VFTGLESFQGQKRPKPSSPDQCLLLPEKRPEERGATGDPAPAGEAVTGSGSLLGAGGGVALVLLAPPQRPLPSPQVVGPQVVEILVLVHPLAPFFFSAGYVPALMQL
jgi:hypothetical protein